jgi:site-specific DNA-methyltransferase (adenine-specific)
VTFTIHHGDCREVMATLNAESVDAIVCDPPYGLSFMGKGWDHGVPGVEFWTEALRVAKPGGHLLAFGGTRTYHRLACAIEDAGWEVRDCVMWVYGSGFPKSHDVSKAIDKAAGAESEREFVSINPASRPGNSGSGVIGETATTANGWRKPSRPDKTAPATDAARQWSGWGTALKPAWEPIIVARKPLVGTVAENVLTHGTGGINVDGCRVGIAAGDQKSEGGRVLSRHQEKNGYEGGWGTTAANLNDGIGRWPANLIHDGSEEVVGLFPRAAGASAPVRGSEQSTTGQNGILGHFNRVPGPFHGDSGSAARFFYCAKASKADRDEGCDGLPQTVKQSVAHGDKRHGTLPYTNEPREMNPRPRGNHHPTVKPTDLMRYLCRLVTPPAGVVLDPFTGSGSTGKGAVLEGFQFIGIEREAEYVKIARARVAAVAGDRTLPEASA